MEFPRAANTFLLKISVKYSEEELWMQEFANVVDFPGTKRGSLASVVEIGLLAFEKLEIAN